jgi:hypothetical protein
MGLIGRALTSGAIASVGEAAEDLSEVFVANATREMELSQEAYAMALEAATEEYRHAGTGVFDRFVNGLNRLPRPLMALGTIGLFVFAMVDPVRVRGAHGGPRGGARAALVAAGRNRGILFRRAGIALSPRAARWGPLGATGLRARRWRIGPAGSCKGRSHIRTLMQTRQPGRALRDFKAWRFSACESHRSIIPESHLP